MITLPILIVCIVLFAWKEAGDDARAIAESNKTGKPFTHDDPDRYIMGIVITLILSVASQLECVTWWALLYFPITWAVFTISFRFLLNRKRGKYWAYVSASNGYDRLWMSISHWSMFGLWPGGNTLQFDSRLYMDGSHLPITRYINRSGTIAYGFEATILLASITIYITKTL